MSPRELWERYRTRLVVCESVSLTLDTSRMGFERSWVESRADALERAFDAMEALERGEIANPDEGRRVGHYWLRAPERAPEPAVGEAIRGALDSIERFADRVHRAEIRPERGDRFSSFLLVGIGGSALGPELVSDALESETDRMRAFFFDNTDPDGFDRVLRRIGDDLGRTLTIVVSKSGGTKETRNGMLEAKRAYENRGLDFARHAAAVTQEGSELDRLAETEGWLERFPMWDWVGGRTSELSAVGLLPARLQGIDVRTMLDGARSMDEATRLRDPWANPAALLALGWLHAGGGRGARDMVILPYKDRLVLFSKYLQQLVMESLGKETDLGGRTVHQGIAVYGNKGSTDQHAYVQQLRDGLDNFFVTFLEVLEDRTGPSIEVEPGTTSGDYLVGFLLGTRRALFERGRESMTITVPDVSPRTLGALIALYERAVGIYASLVNVNAYHQPGVEAGKRAAEEVVALQAKVVRALARRGSPATAEEIAEDVSSEDVETIFKILEHLAANPKRGVAREPGPAYTSARFRSI